MSNLSVTVKQLRKQYNLTQENLALKSGVGLRFVRDLEQGKASLRLDKVNQLLDYFNYEMAAMPKANKHIFFELTDRTVDMNAKAKGYILGAVAAATYGLNPLFALPLYGAGLDPDSVLFFRYLFSLPILALMIKLRGRNFKLQRKEILPIALMGFLFAISSLTLFQSYNHMAAGIASTLLFVYPIMVALIMAVCFKERLTWTTALCIILALSGIGLLYKGEDGDTLSLVGVALVMASSLSYAIYIVSVNRPALKDIATLKLMFYGLAFGMLVFLVRLDFGRSLHLVPSDQWYLWGALVALAVFPTVISLGCTTLAIQYIGSTPAAILGALEPLTAVVIGVLVFGEPLTPRLLCGIVLIVAAVTLVVAGGDFTAYLVRFRKMFPKLPFKKK